MSWVAVGVGAIGLIGGLAQGKAQESSMKEQTKLEIEAQKQLAAQKRQWDLQDRQYRQNAVGNWAGYLDPSLIGVKSTGSGNAQSPGAVAPAKNASASLPTTDKNGMPITDPNDPLFAPNPTAAPGTNVIPINRPGLFGGAPPNLMSFAASNPDYDFFNPNPNYVQRTG